MDNLHSSESQHLIEVIDNHLEGFTEDDEVSFPTSLFQRRLSAIGK